MGYAPLRKLFRYRDQTARPLADHVDHWRDFVWQAGPVCVISKGLAWGVPQVWAKTAEEGKRVIRHAAAIAGVDLDVPEHTWIITGSRSPRYGQEGTMAVVQDRDGRFPITARDGSDGYPVSAIARP
jgi:hypothetical protein